MASFVEANFTQLWPISVSHRRHQAAWQLLSACGQVGREDVRRFGEVHAAYAHPDSGSAMLSSDFCSASMPYFSSVTAATSMSSAAIMYP